MRKFPITKIVIHHSCGGTWESIKAAHKAKGWGNNSAYHWHVEKDGTIQKGVPESDAGFSMHIDLWNPKTWWINEKSIAICVSGNFENEEPTQAQLNSLKKMIAAKIKLYDIDEVLGHRDINATACPGQNLYKLLTFLNMNLFEETIALLKTLWEKQGNDDKKKIGDLAKKIRSAQKCLGLKVSD